MDFEHLNDNSDHHTEFEGLLDKMMEISKSPNAYELSMKLTDYFNLDSDGSLITWSHAVNSKETLDQTLKSNSGYFISDTLDCYVLKERL